MEKQTMLTIDTTGTNYVLLQVTIAILVAALCSAVVVNVSSHQVVRDWAKEKKKKLTKPLARRGCSVRSKATTSQDSVVVNALLCRWLPRRTFTLSRSDDEWKRAGN